MATKIPNVIIYSDSNHSACSFWRSHGVWLELAKQGIVNIHEGTYNDTWTTLRKFDIAFFQRPMARWCLNQVAMAKDLGLKIWVDVDDHNVIPETHPVYDIWKRDYDEMNFKKIMLLSDIVTTTTEYLKNYYLKYTNNVKVVPNAINDYWLKFKKLKSGKNIFIRAGSHHEHDIYKYKDEILTAFDNFNDWGLVVAGSNPIFLQQEIKNYKYIGDLDVHAYFANILNYNCSVFILPLLENELNLGKSNIGWQEATLSGAACLTPEWFNLSEESVIYNNNDDFLRGIIELMEKQELRLEKYTKSVERIKKYFLLSEVNKQRIEIINTLML